MAWNISEAIFQLGHSAAADHPALIHGLESNRLLYLLKTL
ncbi:MAG: hypothetical protein ACI9NT_002413 [Bacteroidia bacterium]|jgi:hypothetical protein